MCDYADLVKGLRDCSRRNARVCMTCGAKASNLCEGTKAKRMFYAADAIEELLAAVRSVVHCKDCKWCHAGYCEKYDDLIPWGCANKPWEDWFCADGKRREAIKEAQDAD